MLFSRYFLHFWIKLAAGGSNSTPETTTMRLLPPSPLSWLALYYRRSPLYLAPSTQSIFWSQTKSHYRFKASLILCILFPTTPLATSSSFSNVYHPSYWHRVVYWPEFDFGRTTRVCQESRPSNLISTNLDRFEANFLSANWVLFLSTWAGLGLSVLLLSCKFLCQFWRSLPLLLPAFSLLCFTAVCFRLLPIWQLSEIESSAKCKIKRLLCKLNYPALPCAQPQPACSHPHTSTIPNFMYGSVGRVVIFYQKGSKFPLRFVVCMHYSAACPAECLAKISGNALVISGPALMFLFLNLTYRNMIFGAIFYSSNTNLYKAPITAARAVFLFYYIDECLWAKKHRHQFFKTN